MKFEEAMTAMVKATPLRKLASPPVLAVTLDEWLKLNRRIGFLEGVLTGVKAQVDAGLRQRINNALKSHNDKL